MKRTWLPLLICGVLSGCAQLPAAPAASAGGADLPAIGNNLMLFNPAGAYYSRWTELLTEGADYDFDVTLVRQNLHPDWVGSAGVCMSGQEPTKEICIQLVAANQDNRNLTLQRVFGKTRLTEPGQGPFHIGEPVHMHVEATGRTVKVSINGGAPLKIQMEDKVDKLTLGCSSALCRFVEK